MNAADGHATNMLAMQIIQGILIKLAILETVVLLFNTG
jgi:hypothetical protein